MVNHRTLLLVRCLVRIIALYLILHSLCWSHTVALLHLHPNFSSIDYCCHYSYKYYRAATILIGTTIVDSFAVKFVSYRNNQVNATVADAQVLCDISDYATEHGSIMQYSLKQMKNGLNGPLSFRELYFICYLHVFFHSGCDHSVKQILFEQ